MKIKILEPIGFTQKKLEILSTYAELHNGEVFQYESVPTNIEELAKRCEDTDVAVISNMSMPSYVLEQAKNLKYIAVAFTGVDHVAVGYCQQNNIKVSNAAGYSTNSVAELTINLALSCFRKLVKNDAITRAGLGRKSELGTELGGKTFGIIGAGAIGLRVAELAKVFGCEVLAYSRTKKEVEGVKFVELNELLSKSDVVSVHVPLTKETTNLLDEKKLAQMKESAILINTARGPIVDYAALSRLLSDGKISGAGLDVYEKEPPLDKKHPIFSAPNTILLPHIGYATQEAIDLRSDIIIDNVLSFLKGEWKNRVY